MQTIAFATTNQGKFHAAERNLRRFGIRVIQKPLILPESRGSIEEIAAEKARYAAHLLHRPTIAMDAGFFIDALNGFPRMFTNFALETIGLPGILTLLHEKKRTASFREVLAFSDGQRKPKTFLRIVSGRVAPKPRGRLRPYHWSPLVLIFIPDGDSKTLGEMTAQEFNAHRRRVDRGSHWEQFGVFYGKPKA
ncbi:MAG: hypothetical protein HY340_03125 [Candidatus Kerfeldbacteria bacterium]|nr:hypothetical protein [Candidatus Kerfeldbacteria bacterium]